jgi:hypothetical protein
MENLTIGENHNQVSTRKVYMSLEEFEQLFKIFNGMAYFMAISLFLLILILISLSFKD